MDRCSKGCAPLCPREILNAYGPTETTIDATCHVAQEDDLGVASLPIGRPLQNYRAYVLDARLEPLGVGVAGELFIGGLSLARGYVGSPALTAQRFIADPFAAEDGARLYRTGDLARWRADGTLEFCGRADAQVKIRGFRIEPGEIEAALRGIAGVADAAVLAEREREDGEARLVAYVAIAQQEGDQDNAPDASLETLRAALAKTLPEHMVPAAFVTLPALPRLPSGKLDAKALPKPGRDAFATRPHEPPNTPREKQIAAIWSKLLDIETIGRNDDFFALGGHSLLAARLVAALAQETGAELSIRALFERPTIAALAEVLEDAAARPSLPPLIRVDGLRPAPLSFQQERLWFLDRLDKTASAAYHLIGALRLSGPLDGAALADALDAVAQRHETLRARFIVEQDAPAQRIEPAPWRLVVEDAQALDDAALAARVEMLLSAPFDLEAGPLFRAHLLERGAAEHILVVGGHHAILDGWSIGLFLREVSELYRAARTGVPADLPQLPVQYGDYAHWQRAALSGERLAAATAFWKNTLQDAPAAITLPFDRPRPAAMDYRGGSVPLAISPQTTHALRELARAEGATLFMALEAAFAALLSLIGGDDDLVLGTVTAGRARVELEPLIGFFVNTLALRHRIDSAACFATLLKDAKATILDAFDHQDAPFAAVVDAVRPQRSLSHAPILQTMFVLQNFGADESLALEGVDVAALCDADRGCGAILSWRSILAESESGLAGALYMRQLFDETSARRIAQRFARLIEAVVAQPQRPLRELTLLDEAERALVLTQWNATAAPVEPATYPQLFAASLARHGARLAAIDVDGDGVSYAALALRAKTLARALRVRGVGPEIVVGLCVRRSLDALVAALAILEAGGVYLPLDPAYPSERLAFMAKRCASAARDRGCFGARS